MYEWTEPYEDEYIKERIEELMAGAKNSCREWQGTGLHLRTALAACPK